VIARTQYADVVQLRMSSRRSRLVGYAVAAYLVRGVLVDTGFPRIRRAVARLLDGTPVRGALITHQHEDHAGNAELLARRGVPLGMGDLTREIISRPIRIELYRRAVWGTAAALPARAERFEDTALVLVPTPGHSPDHHVVWDAERETLFSGDLYLGVKVRLAHAAERPRQTLASLHRVIALAPRRLFCAHRGLVAEPRVALAAKAGWLAETIGRIDARTAQGWSARATRDDVVGREAATGYLTHGEYSRLNFVRAVRADAPLAAAPSG
jgi:glyoxylase-like metal-dependent hydrolase (beta-lactamase superfamily II)